MKRTAILLIIISFFNVSTGQTNLSGDWAGNLKLPGFDLKLIFSIKSTGSNNPQLAYTSTLSVPQQNAKNIPIDKTFVDGNEIRINSYTLNAEFEGELDEDDVIIGNFKQNGQTFPLKLIRNLKVTPSIRPQTPVSPFNYNQEEVSFYNEAGTIKFAGTVTRPKLTNDSFYPTVILLSGSGSQDRDETLFDHKPFAVLSDYLTKNGFAVLRVDDRGAGKTKCPPKLLNYTTTDLVEDASTYLHYALDSVSNGNPIYIIGHSEGAHIAAVIAHQFPAEVKAIVSLAPPLVSGAHINSYQNKIAVEQFLNKKETTAFIALHDTLIHLLINENQYSYKSPNKEALKQKINLHIENWENIQSRRTARRIKKKFYKLYKKEFTEYIPEVYSNIFFEGKWMMEFIQTEPLPIWNTLTPNALILNGEFDQQVPVALNKNIGEQLNNRENINFIIVSNTNHLFQTTKNGAVSEYGNIEETISPKVLELINEFLIKNQF